MSDSQDSQYRPAHGNQFFEAGRPVSVTYSGSEMDAAELLLERLEETPDRERQIILIENAFDQYGIAQAGAAMREIMHKLKGKKGHEIKLALRKAMGEEINFQTEADRLSVTRQTLHTNVQRMQKRMGL